MTYIPSVRIIMQMYNPNLSSVSMLWLLAMNTVVTQQTVMITNENRYLMISKIIPEFVAFFPLLAIIIRHE